MVEPRAFNSTFPDTFESLFGERSRVTDDLRKMLINLVNRSLTESESNSGINGWHDDECPASPIEKPVEANYPCENWDSDTPKENGRAELRKNPIYAGPHGNSIDGSTGADQYHANGMVR